MSFWRIPNQRYAEAITLALELLPPRLRAIAERVPILCADPVAAGLHSWERVSDDAENGSDDDRSLRVTPHHVEPWGIERPARDRVSHIVLPHLYAHHETTTGVLVHEFGHAIETHFGHGTFRAPKPVSEYAEVNEREAWAEAFTAWFVPAHWGWPVGAGERELILRDDPATAHLFDSLSR